MSTPDRHALLLTGAVGVGKTTVATEMGEILRRLHVAHAVIDLDWLAWCRPPEDDVLARRRLLLENLVSLRRNYEAAGIHRLLLPGSIVSEEHREAISGALDGYDVSIVHLTAPLAVVADRLDRRDPGSRTTAAPDGLQEFDARVRAAAGSAPSVMNGDDVVAAARAVLAAASWPPAAGGHAA